MKKWKSWEKETKTLEYQYANGMHKHIGRYLMSIRVSFDSNHQRTKTKMSIFR